ncbi:MAG: aminoglycoside phosphotransferase family protein [Lentisphaeria bacterium]
MTYRFKDICSHFDIYGDFIISYPFGTGHINDTFCVVFNQCGTRVRYTLQRINHHIFKQPELLMENIYRVTEYLSHKNIGKDRSRHCLHLAKSDGGKPYYKDEYGNFWRMYYFVEDARTYDIIENDDQAYQAARAFGKFQGDLVAIPGKRLHETIPDFHNTPMRLKNLKMSIAADKMNRAKDVQKEIDFVLAHEKDAAVLTDLQKSGDIPERITHNDTKLNNILIDDRTGEGICVIDLDTVMPGLAHYDFGDMVRTGTSPAAEDETDLSKVGMQFNRFEALLKGYLSTMDGVLNKTEKKLLPFAGKLITFEIGIRFLTDYLDGDTYFKVHRAGHNLDRARTQFKLVTSIEEQFDSMQKLVDDVPLS